MRILNTEIGVCRAVLRANLNSHRVDSVMIVIKNSGVDVLDTAIVVVISDGW